MLREVWDFCLENEWKRVSSMYVVFICIWEPTLSFIHSFRDEQKSWTCRLLVCSLPSDTQAHSVFIVSVLSVCVCEAWLFWFTEKRCWLSVSLGGDASGVFLCVHGHSYTPIPVPAFVWVLEFAPTNRPLNVKHTQHTQTFKQPEPPRVSPLTSFLLPLSVCLATTLIWTTFESSPILRKPVGFPGANEMPARQMDMREPQSDPTLGSK